MVCSNEFLPYYDECLRIQAEVMSEGERDAIESFFRTCSKCTKVRVDAVQAVCDNRPGKPTTPFPSTCTSECFKVFNPFFDACLDGEPTGLPPGSQEFRRTCQVAVDGGLFFRVKINQDLAKIENMEKYRGDFIQSLGKALKVSAVRFGVTSVVAADSKAKGGEYQSIVDKESKGIIVDAIVKISSVVIDPAPQTLLTQLRTMVALPSSDLYRQPITRDIVSNYGLVNLVPGTHDPDTTASPSSLNVAVAELNKAKEGKAALENIQLLQAIVDYHRSVEYSAAVSTTNAYMGAIKYYDLLVNKATPDKLAAAEANVEYLKAVDNGQPPEVLAVGLAKYNMLNSIAKGAPEAVIERDRAILNWRKAIQTGAKPRTLATLELVVRYLNDVAARASVEQLHLDQARIQYAKDVERLEPLKQLRYDQAVVDYMNLLVVDAEKPALEAAEARIEYQMSHLKDLADYIQQERKAVWDYQSAVANKKPSTLLKQLAATVAKQHKVVVEYSKLPAEYQGKTS